MQPAGLLDPPALPVSLSPPRHRQAAPKVYSTLAVPSMCCAGLVACGPDGRPIRQGSGASEASMRAASPAAAAPSTCSTPSGPSQLPAPAAPGLPAAAGSCQPSCAPMMQGQGQCCPQPSAAAACQQPPAAQPVVYQLARSAGHNGSGSGCMPWPAGMAGAAAAPCCPGGGQEMQQAVQGSGHVQALVGAGLQSVAVAAQQQQQPGGSDSLVQMLTAQMEEMQRLQRVQAEQARLQAAQLERLRNALVQHMGRDGQQ
uniref:Uncharacterized protein n=1 Tax=Chlamydomonas leiostraca TaxID=1034604 RepID=A0A7S0RSF4_9CHLO